MDNTIQLYVDKEKEIKGYPITSPDRVIDENGVNIKEQLDNIEKYIMSDSINMESFSGQNDTEKFYNACNFAINNNKSVSITKDIVLDADIKNDFEVPSLIANNNSINLKNKVRLFISDKTKFIKNVCFIDEKSYIKTDYVGANQGEWDYGYIFEQKDGTESHNIIIDNVKLNGLDVCKDGLYRIRGLAEICGNNIKIINSEINDCRSGFRINKNSYNKQTNSCLFLDKVILKNVEQGFLIFSCDSIFANNLKLINTKEQASNFTSGMGSDLLNIMYSNNVQINNIDSNFAVERTIYTINTNNVIVDGFIINNMGLNGKGSGIKISSGASNYSKNIKILNGLYTGELKTSAFDFYNVDDIKISNVSIPSQSTNLESFINCNQAVKNIEIENCEVSNFTSSFVYSAIFSGSTHLIDGLRIKNCKIINPCNYNVPSGQRFFIQIYDPELVGITVKNIEILDSYICQKYRNEDKLFINENSPLGGIINNIDIESLSIINTEIIGASHLNGFLNPLGVATSNIKYEGKYYRCFSATEPHLPYENKLINCNIDVISSSVNGVSFVNKTKNNKIIKNNINIEYNSLVQGVSYLFYKTTLIDYYYGIIDILFEDGCYAKLKINKDATFTKIAGDCTVGTDTAVFSNGSQLEFGNSDRSLRIRTSETLVKCNIVGFINTVLL